MAKTLSAVCYIIPSLRKISRRELRDLDFRTCCLLTGRDRCETVSDEGAICCVVSIRGCRSSILSRRCLGLVVVIFVHVILAKAPMLSICEVHNLDGRAKRLLRNAAY